MAEFSAGQKVFVVHHDKIREVVIEQVNTYETVTSVYSNYQVLGIGVNQYEARIKAGGELFATKLELMESL